MPDGRTRTAPQTKAETAERLADFVRKQTDALLGLQREFLDECDDASRIWLSRGRTEVKLWSALVAKLATSRTIPERFDACRDTFTKRVQLAAADAQTVFVGYQKLAATMAKPFSHAMAQHEAIHSKQENRERSAPWYIKEKMTA